MGEFLAKLLAPSNPLWYFWPLAFVIGAVYKTTQYDKPRDIIKDREIDPTIDADLHSTNMEVPRRYQDKPIAELGEATAQWHNDIGCEAITPTSDPKLPG